VKNARVVPWAVLVSLIFLLNGSAHGQCQSQSQSQSQSLSLVGDERGNGGSAVVCRDGSHRPTSVELFDVYEQRRERNIVFRASGIQDPVEAAIDLLADVRRFTPHRGEAYEKFVRSFMAQIQWAGDLARVPDLDTDLKAPPGCAFEQLIVRRKVIEFPEDKRFLVDMTLWNAMVPLMKAAAIMHEAFYDEALSAGHHNSRLVRYFLVKMNSDRSGQMTDREFVETTRVSRFPFWEFRRSFQRSFATRKEIEFTESQLKFDQHGSLAQISARKGVPLELYHPFLWDPWLPEQFDKGFYPHFVERVEFRRDGDGITTVAHLTNARRGVRPWALIRDRKVWLAEGSTIEILPDVSLKLKIAGCYVNPDNGLKQCGDILIGPPP